MNVILSFKKFSLVFSYPGITSKVVVEILTVLIIYICSPLGLGLYVGESPLKFYFVGVVFGYSSGILLIDVLEHTTRRPFLQ